MGMVADLRSWLEETVVDGDPETFPPTHYQHLPDATPTRFAWFMIAGSETTGQTLDNEPPDTFYVDLEIYTETTIDLEAVSTALLDRQDYDGDFGEGTIQLVEVTDQRDDYIPLVNRDDLPSYFVSYRLILTGYES